MVRSCLYSADVGCKNTIKGQNEGTWKHAFSYSEVSEELLHLQPGGLLPLRKPLFHAASCFVFEGALAPPVSPCTQATAFSLHILSCSHNQINQRYVTKTADDAQVNMQKCLRWFPRGLPWRRTFWNVAPWSMAHRHQSVGGKLCHHLGTTFRNSPALKKDTVRSSETLVPICPTSQCHFIIRNDQSNHETGYPGVFSSVCHASLAEFIDTSREWIKIVVNFCHGVNANSLTPAYSLPLDCFCLHTLKHEILYHPNDSTNFGMRGGDQN
jgi:hypothetical protein